MKFSFGKIIPIFLFMFSLISCVNDPDTSKDALQVGDPLPAFSVKLDTGETVTTDELRGHISVIILFNTSCPDCREELPVVQQVWETVKENPEVRLFAISREENEESVAAYWHENNLTIPYSAQADRTVYSLFAQSVIPRIFISDKNNIIKASFLDYPLPTVQEILSYIE